MILDFGGGVGSSAVQQAPEFESKPPSVGRWQDYVQPKALTRLCSRPLDTF